MLQYSDLEKINQFKDALHRYHFLENDNKSFGLHVAEALSQFFNYQHVIFGYLDHLQEKDITLYCLTNNISMDFLQHFLSSPHNIKKLLEPQGDLYAFSDQAKYKNDLLYTATLKHHGYADCMTMFLKVNKSYIGYIILLRPKSKKAFTSKDRFILEAIQNHISVEYYNWVSLIKLKNSNEQLAYGSRLYPMGIIIMKDANELTYINDTASSYLNELGIIDHNFFSVFYNNHILPKIKLNVANFGQNHLIRHKNLIFSIAAMTEPFTKEIMPDMSPTVSLSQNTFNLYPNMTTYVYIFKDEFSVANSINHFFDTYTLTKREHEIVELISQGRTNAQIAKDLHISPNTVKVHVQNIFSKVKVSSRSELLFKLQHPS